jgi:hypothetical protein
VTDRLIDAEEAGELLGVPASWILEEARHDRIPYIPLGKYRRFEAAALLAWARNRSRGPTYHLQQNNKVAPAVVEHPEA